MGPQFASESTQVCKQNHTPGFHTFGVSRAALFVLFKIFGKVNQPTGNIESSEGMRKERNKRIFHQERPFHTELEILDKV